jgi:uncharacterized protein YxeA
MKRSIFAVVALLLVTFAVSAFALEPDKNGWFFTGSGVRTKSVAFVSVKVYAIRHDMKALPPAKSKQAVIDADVDKKITWRMLRDVDAEKIQNALKEAYQMNGYSDGGKIGSFLGAMNKELKEGTYVTISYSAANKTTSINVSNGGSASIAGPDFMKATWSIWFGKIDQPSLGDAMIGNL